MNPLPSTLCLLKSLSISSTSVQKEWMLYFEELKDEKFFLHIWHQWMFEYIFFIIFSIQLKEQKVWSAVNSNLRFREIIKQKILELSNYMM